MAMRFLGSDFGAGADSQESRADLVEFVLIGRRLPKEAPTPRSELKHASLLGDPGARVLASSGSPRAGVLRKAWAAALVDGSRDPPQSRPTGRANPVPTTSGVFARSALKSAPFGLRQHRVLLGSWPRERGRVGLGQFCISCSANLDRGLNRTRVGLGQTRAVDTGGTGTRRRQALRLEAAGPGYARPGSGICALGSGAATLRVTPIFAQRRQSAVRALG